MLVSAGTNAQKKTAFLQFSGNVSSGNKKLSTAQLLVYENGDLKQTIPAKENGSWVVTLDLGQEYILVYSCPGYVSKSVEVNTVVPPDAADISYVQKFNMELPEDIQGLSKTDPMSKPIARWKYTPGIDDFDFDPVYTKRIRDEQAQAARDAAAERASLNQSRLDSLNKIWNDSIARAKEAQSAIDSKNAALAKAKQDSITAAQASAAAFAAAEKLRVDSAMRAEAERKRQEEIARQKAKQDSIDVANADLKKKQEEEKRAALLLAQEKARQDSISKAEANASKQAEIARQKQIADSIATVLAQSEARKRGEADSIRKVREAEALALKEAQAKRQKEIAYSTANARVLAEARKKEAADSTAKALANADARKKAEADSINKVRAAEALALKDAQAKRQKEIADSTANAKAVADARRKEIADSTAKAKIDEAARQKAAADALALETARKKIIADSTSRAEAEAARLAAVQAKADEDARMKAQAEARAKAVKDSTDAANAEALRKRDEAAALALAQKKEQERKKFIADSTSKAESEAAIAKAFAAEEAKQAENKRIQDSLALIEKAEKDKAAAERQAKIQEDIQAKKDALARANRIDTTRTQSTKSTTTVPKIRESDYQEGITDETVNESNRSILRTVVKKDGVTYNYQKITYNWGGVFYFKNEQSITAILFDQEINNARKSFAK